MTMTQMQSARAGKITDEMKIVAQEEKMNIELFVNALPMVLSLFVLISIIKIYTLMV